MIRIATSRSTLKSVRCLSKISLRLNAKEVGKPPRLPEVKAEPLVPTPLASLQLILKVVPPPPPPPKVKKTKRFSLFDSF